MYMNLKHLQQCIRVSPSSLPTFRLVIYLIEQLCFYFPPFVSHCTLLSPSFHHISPPSLPSLLSPLHLSLERKQDKGQFCFCFLFNYELFPFIAVKVVYFHTSVSFPSVFCPMLLVPIRSDAYENEWRPQTDYGQLRVSSVDFPEFLVNTKLRRQ